MAFDLFDAAVGLFSWLSPLVVETFEFDFFNGATIVDDAVVVVVVGFGSFGSEFDNEAAELLRRARPPCELDDDEPELDEFESESLELPLDDDEPELVQLESVVLTD